MGHSWVTRGTPGPEAVGLLRFGANDDAGAALVDLHEGTGNRRMGGREDFDPETASLGAVAMERADEVGVGAGELLACGAVSAGAELAVAGSSGPAGQVGEAVAAQQAHGAPVESGRDKAGPLGRVGSGQEAEEAVLPRESEIELAGDGDFDPGPGLRRGASDGLLKCGGVGGLPIVDTNRGSGVTEGDVALGNPSGATDPA